MFIKLYSTQKEMFTHDDGDNFYFSRCTTGTGSKKYGSCKSYEDFILYQTTQPNNLLNFSELLKHDRPRYEYYDIDFEYSATDEFKSSNKVFQEFKQIHENFCLYKEKDGNTEWRITDSSKEGKISLHLINKNTVWIDHSETKSSYDSFAKFIDTHYKDQKTGFDPSVASRNRVMRLINNSKFNQDRPLQKAGWHTNSLHSTDSEFVIQNVDQLFWARKKTNIKLALKTELKNQKKEHMLKEKNRLTAERGLVNMGIIDREDDEIESLVTLISDTITTEKSDLCDSEFKQKVSYKDFRNLSFAYISACKEIEREEIYSFWESDIFSLYRHSHFYKAENLWNSLYNSETDAKSYSKASLHYWAKQHPEYKMNFCVFKGNVQIGVFDPKDTTYYWGDFLRHMITHEFLSIQKMQTYFLENFNRVCIPILGAKLNFLLKTENNLFSPVDNLSSNGVKVVDQKIKDMHRFCDLPDMYLDIYNNYNGTVFTPYDCISKDFDSGINLYNTYYGFKSDWVDTDDFSLIQPILDHIMLVWANNDKEKYTHIISWIAHIIKFPERLTKVMLILYSDKQQTGKGIIGEWLINFVFGLNVAGKTNDLEKVTGRFNSFIDRKLLCVLDDTSSYDTYKSGAWNKLKSLITDPSQTIEYKGVNTTKNQTNYCNYMLFTNQNNAVKIETGDRRMAVYKCNDSKAGNQEYFNKLGAILKDQNIANIFTTYLYNMPMDQLVDPRSIPQTKDREEMMNNTLEQPKKFLLDIKTGEYTLRKLFEYNWITKQTLYEEFQNWIVLNGEKQGVYSKRKFGSCIKESITNICKKVNGKPVKVWQVDTINI